MQAKGFFGSLFDYSFSSFITPRIIKVLYVLMTISVTLWTLAVILVAFKASSALGIFVLLIGAPLFFVIMMIYARVGLELLMAFFNIHGDVAEINKRGGGGSRQWMAVQPIPTPEAVVAVGNGPTPQSSATAPESSVLGENSVPSGVTGFCENCGSVRVPGKRFCTSCGEPFA